MARTTTKPKAAGRTTARERPNGASGEVLTLAEAAAYLRLPEAEVVRLVHGQGLPGRLAGKEWRFLNAALRDWLRTPPNGPSKEAMLSTIGSWKDDPYLDDMLKEIYRKRKRSAPEDDE